MSYSQKLSLQSCSRKINQNDKEGHLHHGCCHCNRLESPVVRPSMQLTNIKKALGRFLLIFKPKRSAFSFQGWFLCWDDIAVHTATSDQCFQWRQRHKDDLLLTLHCPKSSLENILAPKFSLPAWGYCQFSFRKFLFSNIQGKSTSSLWENFPPMIST